MTIPDYQALMLPLLKRAALGETRIPEAEKQLGDEFSLTPDERAQLLPSGKQRVLQNRAHWAKFYMMKAGLVSFPKRGTFVVTDAGKKLLAQNPSHIDIDLLRQYPSFEEFYNGDHVAAKPIGTAPAASTQTTVLQSTPEEQIEIAFVALQSALRTHLLQRIFQSTPGFFEEVIIDLLVKMGYGGSRPDAATQLGKSGDGGVDGVINEDRLGLDRVYVQAKLYAEGNVVGRPADGADMPEAINAIAVAACAIGIEPDEVWCASGSGVLARGLAAAWPNARGTPYKSATSCHRVMLQALRCMFIQCRLGAKRGVSPRSRVIRPTMKSLGSSDRPQGGGPGGFLERDGAGGLK
jgi:restriction system protein